MKSRRRIACPKGPGLCDAPKRLQQGFSTGEMGSERRFAWQQSRRSNVRFGSKADIAPYGTHVRFTPKSGHRNSAVECPLCAKRQYYATQRNVALFNHLVGAGKGEVGRLNEPSCLCATLLRAGAIHEEILENECTIPRHKRVATTEARYLAILSQRGLYSHYLVFGAAMRTGEWCGRKLGHVALYVR